MEQHPSSPHPNKNIINKYITKEKEKEKIEKEKSMDCNSFYSCK